METDYNSKYSGEQVEALLDQVANGEVGGETLTEADIANMGFTKNQGTITEVKMNGVSKGASGVVDLGNVVTEHQDISGKVDKVIGKGLSTEDFTTALKGKLEGLSNYDDTALSNALTTLRNDFDKLVSGDSTTAIKTFNEIIAFLDGIADTEDLASIIASIEQQIAGKQATITDLATIRDGASKGATAVQPSSLATVATSGSYNDLSDSPWQHVGSSLYSDRSVEVDGNLTIYEALHTPSLYDKDDQSGSKGQVLTADGDGNIAWEDNVTESTVSGWGFTKNTGTYSKPSGGIPKTDLASDVQSVLDNAVQMYKYVDMDLIQTQGLEGSLSGKLYALPNEATGEEDDILLSKNTIKTINGQSIFGSGDITIKGSGGSSGGSEYAGNYPVVESTNYSSVTLNPNEFTIQKYYVGKGWTLSVGLSVPSNTNIVNEYILAFYCYSGAISFPSSVVWGNNNVPIIESGYTYIVSIVDNIALYTKVEGNIYNTIAPPNSGGGDN